MLEESMDIKRRKKLKVSLSSGISLLPGNDHSPIPKTGDEIETMMGDR